MLPFVRLAGERKSCAICASYFCATPKRYDRSMPVADAPLGSHATDFENFAQLRSDLDHALPILMPLLYSDLRRLASAQRRRLQSSDTLCTTAIVSELYLRFAQSGSLLIASRRHFFALAALAMRQILTDHARRSVLQPQACLPEQLDGLVFDDPQRVLEIDDLLLRLEAHAPRLAQVVTCRFFGGYSDLETAEILGITDRTVRRDWDKAKVWMSAALIGDPA